MGPGVYFMSSKDKCVSLAKSAHCGGAGVVAVVEVDLGRLKGLWHAGADLASWQADGHHDAAYTKHPPWHGMELREFCVKNPGRIKITGWIP
jgi:hypothetical protein